METAVFVRKPSTFEHIIHPDRRTHRIRVMPYEIAVTVRVGGLDWGNFSNGLDVERDFLEEHALLCRLGDVYRCILVKHRRRKDGILAVADLEGYLIMAAYLPEKNPDGSPSDLIRP